RLPLSRSAPSCGGSVGSRSRRDLARRDDLSAAPPAPARPDRAPAEQLPLSRHRIRLPRGLVLHPPLQPPAAPGPRRRASSSPRTRRPNQARIQKNQHTGHHMNQPPPIRRENFNIFSPTAPTQAGLVCFWFRSPQLGLSAKK